MNKFSVRWQELFWALPPGEMRSKLRALEIDVAQENARLISRLAECYRLSGADPDGNEDWRLADYAVAAVAELRRSNDDFENMSDTLREENTRLKNDERERDARIVKSER